MKRRDLLLSLAAGAGVLVGKHPASGAGSYSIMPDMAANDLANELNSPSTKTLFAVFKLSEDMSRITLERKYPETDAEKRDVAAISASDKTLAQSFEKKIWPVAQSAITSAESRYVVVKASGVDKSGAVKKATLFFVWNPDAAPTKQKMLILSAKNSLRNRLQVDIDVQAAVPAEFSLAKARSTLGIQ